MPLTYLYLIDCIFSHIISIDHFISPNYILFAIYSINNIFSNFTIGTYLKNLFHFSYGQFENNYFCKISYNKEKYVFQIFQGTWIMTNNLFEDNKLITVVRNLMDVEICNSFFINNIFIFQAAPKDLLYFTMIHCFRCFDISMNSSKFISFGNGVNYGFFISEDTLNYVVVKNSYFILINTTKDSVAHGFFCSGTPQILFEKNHFVNLTCNPYLTDIRKIVGCISFQGVSSFSGFSNKFLVKIISNTFTNCSCIYGGAIGILNYNHSILKDNFIVNSNSKFGGFFYALNCYRIEISDTITNISSAHRGSIIYIANNYYTQISYCKFEKSFGKITGAIEAKNVKMLLLNHNVVDNTYSNIGSFLCLYGSSTFITNTSLTNGHSNFYGGMIYLNLKSNLTLKEFISNFSSSEINGGFLYAESSDFINIDQTSFDNSISKANGACLFVNSITEFNLKNVKFINCEAKINGIIFVMSLESSASIKFYDLLCFNNKAFFGSCIFYESPNNLLINNFICNNNQGLVIKLNYVYPYEMILKNGVFSNNKINKYLLSNFIMNLKMENITFMNNSKCSSLIYIEKANVSFVNFTMLQPFDFQNNQNEEITEAAIIQAWNSIIILKNIIFQGFDQPFLSNTLIFLRLIGSDLILLDSLIQNNFYQKPGLFILENSHLEINHSLFLQNKGPLFILINSKLSLFNSYFDKNYGNQNTSITDFEIKKIASTANLLTQVYCENIRVNIREGLSFFLKNIDYIFIANSNFIGISNTMAEGLFFMDCKSVKISHSLFIFTRSFQGSALNFLNEAENIFSKVELNQNKFYFCESFKGGAIYLKGHFNLIIFLNIFAENKAYSLKTNISNIIGVGGVLAFLDAESDFSKFLLENNTFSKNNADVAPTIYSDIKIESIENMFYDNSDNLNNAKTITCAPYKIEIIYFKSEINEINSFDSDSLLLNISSGKSFLLNYEIKDAYGQKLGYDNGSSSFIQQITFTNIKKIENDISISNGGLYSLNKLNIYGSPDSIYLTQILMVFTDLFKVQHKLNYTISFYSRKCKIGEIYDINFICKRCPVNFYSTKNPMYNLNNSSLKFQKCEPCPINSFCPGGHMIIPHIGYWRMSPFELKMVPCQYLKYCISIPLNLSYELIIGNLSYYEDRNDILKGFCLEGHENNLCHECIYGFGKYNIGSICEICKNNDSLAIIRLVLVLFFISIYVIVVSNQILFGNNESSLFDEVSKVYINHFQKISLIIFLDIKNLLDSFQEIFNVFNIFSITNEDIFSNDCFLQKFIAKNNQDEIYLGKMIITQILPIFISFVSLYFVLILGFFILCFDNKIQSFSF